MHYVDVGEGDPLVLLHGDPTWGYLYRHFLPPLARRARCIVPDHMGMGKSGVPAGPYPYQLRHHIDNLEAFILRLELRDITLAVHDWGGQVGLGFAIRHPSRLKRLILMNTWAFARWPGGPLPRLIELIRSPRGEAFIMGKNGYVQPALVGTTALRTTSRRPSWMPIWPHSARQNPGSRCCVGHAIFPLQQVTHPTRRCNRSRTG